MTPDPKPGAAGGGSAAGAHDLFRVAIVGAATLKGKEVKEVLGDRDFPATDIKLLDDDESLGQLDAVKDEATFIQSVRPEHFDGVDFVFFASEEKFTRKHWQMARHAGCALVDVSYGLEAEQGVAIRSTWIERELRQATLPELQPAPVVAAHPGATVLGLLLLRAQRAGRIRSAVANIFEPASEHGRRGMDELHEQTVNLLSFQQMPTAVFDTQIAFNLVARYGEKAMPTLASVERRILTHYRRVLALAEVPVPSLMLVQAPIFHGHVFSIYIELEQPVSPDRLEAALEGEHVDLVGAEESDSPSNVSAAGQEEIMLLVRRDSQRPNALWLWAAADNLRITATTAVECAESMAAARPKGKVQ
jgi:aspartate-semialdehyde dehydrogenase